MKADKRIEKNVLKVLSGIEWTIMKALIDLYPEFRFREANGPKWFTMIVPKDLHRHFDLKIASFWVYVNQLLEKKFLTRKWTTERGIAVELNLGYLQEFEDGIPGVFSWRRKIKEIMSAVLSFALRVVTWKRK